MPHLDKIHLYCGLIGAEAHVAAAGEGGGVCPFASEDAVDPDGDVAIVVEHFYQVVSVRRERKGDSEAGIEGVADSFVELEVLIVVAEPDEVGVCPAGRG